MRTDGLELKMIGVHKADETLSKMYIDREYETLFLLRWDGDIKTLHRQESEVDDLKFMPLGIFEREVLDPSLSKKYVSHGNAYYKKVISAIRKELKD